MDSLNVHSKSRSPSPGRLNAVKQEYVGVPSVREAIRSRSPTCRHVRCNSSDAGMMRDIFGSQPPADDGSSNISPALQQQHEDDLEVSVLNGSMDLDDGSGRKSDIEHMYTKIMRTKDRIKGEQTAKEENVNEYLKLSSHADRSQKQRIKAVFEKKNQKSAQSIQHLQKKLESYYRKVRELEAKAAQQASAIHHHHRQPREVLRDMGQGLKHVGGNIRDGITGLSGSVMAKPREFAHRIRNKFGSADNINSLSRNGESDSLEDEKTHHGSATLPGGCSLGSGLKFTSEEGSECSSVTSESVPGGGTSGGATGGGGTSGGPHLEPSTSPLPSTVRETALTSPEMLGFICNELRSRKTETDRLREKFESIKDSVHKDVTCITQALVEERFRYERLEEQINDLTELHQNEVENLKTAVADMEEKVQYQSEERLRDIHDMLEACQTKISKMEHQQAQHQQYLTLEGLDNSNARALIVKLINVLLMVLQVILLLVATVAGIIMPFLRTRLRVLSTAVLAIALIIVMKQWGEITEASQSVTSHLGSLLLSRS